jgi:hypothetical protein
MCLDRDFGEHDSELYGWYRSRLQSAVHDTIITRIDAKQADRATSVFIEEDDRSIKKTLDTGSCSTDRVSIMTTCHECVLHTHSAMLALKGAHQGFFLSISLYVSLKGCVEYIG